MIELLAERIQSHPFITGFLFRERPHVINVFADNIIVMPTNTQTSLPQAHKLVTEFSRLSIYKVNHSKSLILDLNIPKPVIAKLKEYLPYTWAKSSISYLSITATPSYASLEEANYKPCGGSRE